MGMGFGFDVGLKDMQSKLTKRFRTMNSAKSDVEIRSVSTHKYKLIHLCGRGAFSEVHVGKKGALSPFKYAVKICSFFKDDEDDDESEKRSITSEKEDKRLRPPLSSSTKKPRPMSFEKCLSEIQILRRVQTKSDKYIVHLFDSFVYEKTVWIVMELLACSLRELLELQNEMLVTEITVSESAVYMHDMLLALKHLKRHRVIHRDVKPTNIVLSNIGRIKLIDFGISTIVPPGQTSRVVTSRIGTEEYMTSELSIKGATYDYTVDLWALGVTLFNICNRGNNIYGWDNGRFKDEYSEAYQVSFGHYLETAFGLRVVTQDLRTYPPNTALQQHHGIRKIVQKCLVPLPKNGAVKFPITRGVAEQRVTWEEFFQWAEGYVGGMSELSRRQVFMKHVRLVKELRVKRQLRIREFDWREHYRLNREIRLEARPYHRA